VVFNSLTFLVFFACVLLLHSMPFNWTTKKVNLLIWVATLAFSGQIFCDFAGYSTTAIGVAMCLGFAMPDNFRFPYAAVGFSDFWRRWHITLSAWLRDYLYIPLGGNRHGEARTHLSLMVTMLLGGLWHGASWTFVVWGGLHGLYLSTERVLRARFAGYRPGPLTLLGLGLLTYALVNVTYSSAPTASRRRGCCGRNVGCQCAGRAHSTDDAPDDGCRYRSRHRIQALAHARPDTGNGDRAHALRGALLWFRRGHRQIRPQRRSNSSSRRTSRAIIWADKQAEKQYPAFGHTSFRRNDLLPICPDQTEIQWSG
jgi:hypothetical protein